MAAASSARRRRLPLLLLALLALVAVVLVAGSGFGGALTYYKTPSELVAAPVSSTTLRLGGLVVRGSLERTGPVTTFTLTDGATDIEVVSRDQPPGTFREGQGAVVEGRLGSDGVFEADQIIVRHSNEYRPPDTAGS